MEELHIGMQWEVVLLLFPCLSVIVRLSKGLVGEGGRKSGQFLYTTSFQWKGGKAKIFRSGCQLQSSKQWDRKI